MGLYGNKRQGGTRHNQHTHHTRPGHHFDNQKYTTTVVSTHNVSQKIQFTMSQRAVLEAICKSPCPDMTQVSTCALVAVDNVSKHRRFGGAASRIYIQNASQAIRYAMNKDWLGLAPTIHNHQLHLPTHYNRFQHIKCHYIHVSVYVEYAIINTTMHEEPCYMPESSTRINLSKRQWTRMIYNSHQAF